MAVLEQAGFATTCIVRDVELWGQHTFDAKTLMQRTFAEIDRSDLVVVDFAEKGVGLGIEAGYAYGKGLPILVIVPQGSPVSTTLAGIATCIGSNIDDEALVACCDRLGRKACERDLPNNRKRVNYPSPRHP